MTNNLLDLVVSEQSQIEKMFVGAVLIDGDFARTNAGWLTEDLLLNDKYATFWRRVKEGNAPIEVATVLGIDAELFGYVNLVQNYQNIGDIAAALSQKGYIRQAVEGAQQIVKAAQESDLETIHAVAEAITKNQTAGEDGLRDPYEIAESLKARILAGNMTIAFYLESLDETTGGSERGTMTIIAARPSMGKSSLMWQICEDQAVRGQYRVVFFALEMSAEQMYARRVCHKIGKTWLEVRNKEYTSAEETQLLKYIDGYAEMLAEVGMRVVDSTYTSSSDIIRTQLKHKFDVVAVDHGGLMKDRKLANERHDLYIGRQSEGLHSLAKNTNSVVYLLWQLNRGVEGRQDKRPTMADLRDSGHLEQNADNVGLLYGNWYYDPHDEENITELFWAKYRDGVKNSTSYVQFDRAAQRFDSVSMEDMNEYSAKHMNDVIQQRLMNDSAPQLGPDDDIPF